MLTDIDEEVATTNSNVVEPGTPAPSFVSFAASNNPYEYVQQFNMNDPSVANSFQQFYNSVYVQAYHQAYNDIVFAHSAQQTQQQASPSPYMLSCNSPSPSVFDRCDSSMSIGTADTPCLPDITEETSLEAMNPLHDRPVSCSPTFSKLQSYCFKMKIKGMTREQLNEFLKLVEAF
jgi:hypothetical protein